MATVLLRVKARLCAQIPKEEATRQLRQRREPCVHKPRNTADTGHHLKLEGSKEDSSPRAFRGNMACPHLSPESWLPEL